MSSNPLAILTGFLACLCIVCMSAVAWMWNEHRNDMGGLRYAVQTMQEKIKQNEPAWLEFERAEVLRRSNTEEIEQLKARMLTLSRSEVLKSISQ